MKLATMVTQYSQYISTAAHVAGSPLAVACQAAPTGYGPEYCLQSILHEMKALPVACYTRFPWSTLHPSGR